MKSIIESKMVFEFKEEQIFCIENSQLQRRVGDGIKTVEFIVNRKENLLEFIEAKSSSPRPTKENNEQFETFINDIADKFIHSFNLYYSAIHGRYPAEEIAQPFLEIESDKVTYRFILIIKGHHIEWLLPLQEALHRKLHYHITIWKSDVILMNEEVAKERKLITAVL
ncbi:MAG: hypothetical protein ACRCWY_12090 [Cellulosilyticaceae bacterium]